MQFAKIAGAFSIAVLELAMWMGTCDPRGRQVVVASSTEEISQCLCLTLKQYQIRAYMLGKRKTPTCAEE